MSDNVDDFLAHYGVPGMKWGKRKAVNPEKYQKKADQAVRKSTDEYNRLRSEQGRGSKQTKAAKKEMKIAKERAKAAPSLIGAVAGALAKKERYTNPSALQKRNQAGKLAAAAVITGLASSGLRAAAVSMGENSKAANGVQLASSLLSGAGGLLTIGSIAKGADAAITERNSREK
jgi:hypothetical protein